MAEGLSLRAIALRLGRRPSTVSREVARHGGRDRYRAALADERAWDRARRRKPCKLATVPMLRELVAVKLAEDWSPQQISGWLARTYPGEEALQVSTETIYRSLFVQARGVLRKELTAHLRTRRTMRRSKRATRKEQGRGGIVDGVFSFSSTSVARRPSRRKPHRIERLWWWSWAYAVLAGASAAIVTLHALLGLPDSAAAWPWWSFAAIAWGFAFFLTWGLSRAGQERPIV